MENSDRLHDISPMEDMSVPDNLEEIIRESVYASLEDMPREERRAQRVSYIMGMLPRGVTMTREQIENFVDSQ